MISPVVSGNLRSLGNRRINIRSSGHQDSIMSVVGIIKGSSYVSSEFESPQKGEILLKCLAHSCTISLPRLALLLRIRRKRWIDAKTSFTLRAPIPYRGLA